AAAGNSRIAAGCKQRWGLAAMTVDTVSEMVCRASSERQGPIGDMERHRDTGQRSVAGSTEDGRPFPSMRDPRRPQRPAAPFAPDGAHMEALRPHLFEQCACLPDMAATNSTESRTLLGTLIYELLDAHADTVELAAGLQHDPLWRAHLEYLRALH